MKQPVDEILSYKADVSKEFSITLMSCNGCESIIEKVMGKHNGVSFVKTPILFFRLGHKNIHTIELTNSIV